MSTNIKYAKNTSNIPPMEAGTYAAVCCAVIDLGLQKTTYDGKEREVVQTLIIWEFPDEIIEIDGEKRPRWLSKIYTFSVSEKANLRKDLKSWRGRDFTEQELSDFDIKNVIGAPCMITVSRTEKGGNIYANISSIGKLMKGLSVGCPSKQYHFDMDDRGTWSVFPDMPEWIQRKANDSLTLKSQGIQIDKSGRVVEIGNAPVPNDAAFDAVYEEEVDESELPF